MSSNSVVFTGVVPEALTSPTSPNTAMSMGGNVPTRPQPGPASGCLTKLPIEVRILRAKAYNSAFMPVWFSVDDEKSSTVSEPWNLPNQLYLDGKVGVMVLLNSHRQTGVFAEAADARIPCGW